MSPPKKSGSRKDPLKSPKVWERARREKMKIYFNELQEVLPFYDPSAPMSRFEILQKSKVYIKDLQDQNQDLLNGGFDEVYKIKMTKLKQRVKELLRRIDQLTDLLRTAKIMIPPLEAYPEGVKSSNGLKWMSQRPKKWTEKINLVVPDDKIKNILSLIKDYKKNSGSTSLKKKQVSEKSESSLANESCLQKTLGKKKKLLKKNCKIVNIKTPNNGKTYKKNAFSESQSPSQFKENQPVNFNLLTSVNESNTVQNQTELTITGKNFTESFDSQPRAVTEVAGNKVVKSQKLTDTQQNLYLPSATKVMQSNVFILTNDGDLVQIPILNSSENVFTAKPNFIAPAPLIKSNTGLLGPLVVNKPSPVIVLQKTPQVIQTAQIINTNSQLLNACQPSVQILGGSVVLTSSCSTITPKTLPDILSKAPINKKRISRDSTVTTFVNKIPIAALSKQSYAKINSVNCKEKINVITRNPMPKSAEGESNNKITNEVQNGEKLPSTQGVNLEEIPNKKKNDLNSDNSHKRSFIEEKADNCKKQKLEENSLVNSGESVFKPIENETGGMFCSLELPNSINPSLSVSPTAAFLSSFPIVAPSRSEAEEELSERRGDEGKNNSKENNENSALVSEKNKENREEKDRKSRDALEIQENLVKEKINEKTKKQMKLTSNNKNVDSIPADTAIENGSINKSAMNNSGDRIEHLEMCKSWNQFQNENCEIRTEAFYLPSENNIQITSSASSTEGPNGLDISFPGMSNINLSFNSFNQNVAVKPNHEDVQNSLNNQTSTKNNHFEYSQKENYISKISNYNGDRETPKKLCSSNIIDSYSVSKTQSEGYQMHSGPDYHLIPAKEVPNQRNSRTVNWMTEPDNRNRNLVFVPQNDKESNSRAPNYNSPDNFFINNQIAKMPSDYPGHFTENEQSKTNYQKNDFYIKDQQRCKAVDRRTDSKFYSKNQNSCNIFDYNFPGSCYEEDDSNKFSGVQPYSGKNKKNVSQGKKKLEDIHPVVNEHQTSNATKRLQDQIITNIDFNPISSQECFTWVPGKNMEWLPGKSFGLDSNLVVPSTLPTLVGDLALGTNPGSEGNQNKSLSSKTCQNNLKTNGNDLTKDYMDLNMGHNSNLPKAIEPVDGSRQYLEPFANLSKNIFDVTPNVNNAQPPKNDFDKIHFPGSNNNETIVLKNIFELPVSKCSSGGEFPPRSKQRTLNNSQNTFLSVSQLVEPPNFEASSIKNDGQMEVNSSKDLYAQNYTTYNQKTYKSKSRSSHCKYTDRKYQNYKNVSSSYTAEALIRSNTNLNYQTNEFGPEVNINFFNIKSNQKVEQLPNNKIDLEINIKSDFATGPSQNIYSDFNFSSPVPNFTIGSTVATEFVNHDPSSNFSTQNNSFLGDFIAPEFPLSENVSNSLLLPPCSIALQNPFVIDKRNVPPEKNKNNLKQCCSSRNKKHFDCSKTSFTEYPVPSTSAIFTTSSLPCPPIFTTSACQNLLSVPTQNIPISFSSPSFTTTNISFPSFSSTANTNYHINPQNSNSTSFLSSSAMLTTCVSKPLPSSHNCYSSKPLTSATNSVISSSFPVGNTSFSASSQSTIPFFSLSNPIIPSSVPTSSSNSLANFNLSTIFPEINQKGNYHYS